jgi:hypothetical protein
MIKSGKRTDQGNAIQGKGKKSELSYVAGKAGSTRMADGKFKGEREVLNLEGWISDPAWP